MLKFVEAKTPDYTRIADILEACAASNLWANRGPVYYQLRAALAAHMNLPSGTGAVPCSNAGVALEGMARLLAKEAGYHLRWVVSAFSFRNLGRGYFADAQTIDCAPNGLMDLEALEGLAPDSWDGVIVVNPFGQATSEAFAPFMELAQKMGKHLLLDNAAGVSPVMPDWPWQSLSLHHTKPYGVGEGGMALIPSDREEALYELFDYRARPDPPQAWLNNGKISDISCAFILDRLERVETWRPTYLEQAARIETLALQSGLTPLLQSNPETPAMSHAYLTQEPVPASAFARARHITFGKYYQPLVSLPQASALFERIINVPTHGDVATLKDQNIKDDISRVLE